MNINEQCKLPEKATILTYSNRQWHPSVKLMEDVSKSLFDPERETLNWRVGVSYSVVKHNLCLAILSFSLSTSVSEVTWFWACNVRYRQNVRSKSFENRIRWRCLFTWLRHNTEQIGRKEAIVVIARNGNKSTEMDEWQRLWEKQLSQIRSCFDEYPNSCRFYLWTSKNH